MSLLVVVQNIFLVAALLLSNVFYLIDAESFNLFQNASKNRKQILEREMRQVAAIVAAEASIFSEELESLYYPTGKQDIGDQYERAALIGTPHLMHLLGKTNVSGAFFTLKPTAEEKIPAVYIRTTTSSREKTVPENCLMEVGPIEVSREHRVATSVRWDLKLPFPQDQPEKTAFYDMPVRAYLANPQEDYEHFGYWSSPVALLSDEEEVVYYSLPLHDKKGRVYGVLGVEISMTYFIGYYLRDMELPYENSFYAIAPLERELLSSKGLIPSSTFADAYLGRQEKLPLFYERDNIYKTKLEGIGQVYACVQELSIYNPNSPFRMQKWNLIGFAPRSGLHAGSHQIRRMMIFSFGVASLLSVFAIFLIAYMATRKITGLSSYVRKLSPSQEISFQETGLQEIDDLTSALEMLNRRMIESSRTFSKILKLSLLPIGGYEINRSRGQVVLIGYILELFGLKEGEVLTMNQWFSHRERLLREPSQEYENVYHFDGTLWLRVVETETKDGVLGVVLDVTRDIEERIRLSSELDYDPLTRLYNRSAFKREVQSAIQEKPEKIGAMLFIDLDNLKYINDNFGHETGDNLIARAAEMFYDFIHIGGLVSRVSGDEFSVYLHGFDSKEEARTLIEEHLAKNHTHTLQLPDGSRHPIRFSSGLAWYPEDADNIVNLLRLSDFAMYEAKSRDKGTMMEFDRESYEHNAYLLDNREAISRLIDEKKIHFHFQPIVSLRTGEIYAYEALMRSSMPEFHSSMQIIHVASTQSKLAQLERLVFFTALRTVKEQYERLGERYIFINSMPDHLLSGEDFERLREEFGNLFSKMVLEVTEMESDRLRHLEDRLELFRREGIRLAIDDFGSGYSNEMRILQVRPDIVKIDMGLIQGVHENKDKQQLIANLVSFCHTRSVLLVGEGVEDPEDLKKLIELDVDLVQGYYTARPSLHLEPLRPGIREEILRLVRQKGEMMNDNLFYL